jgi:YbgC/YbaW family acyl-CoA thioester hydrolase
MVSRLLDVFGGAAHKRSMSDSASDLKSDLAADLANDLGKSKSRIHEYPLTILESHLDTFGHVNNAVYLQLFEQSRWEIITDGGYGLKEVHLLQVGPTVLDIHMQFKRELKLREKVTIRSWITSTSRKTMTMRQVMIKSLGTADEQEACRADFVIGLFDLKARKLVEPSSQWLQAIGINS